ncbi:zinc finger protein 213-like [Nerophis ophidion]|uniref:zinc finger protein 213-like n=1 Tax=Nerophis ophidion TaxID=159077 RepID=UPI002AE05CF5|nr:zinc finger protein 213-like [Nerophis ophidion]
MCFLDLRRAVLNRTGCASEDHRHRFRVLCLGPEYRPFLLEQQLQDAATRWLQPGDSDGRVLELVVLEQFLEAIPTQTSAWVRYPRPRDLAAAVTLAGDHQCQRRAGRAQQEAVAPLVPRHRTT